MIDNDRLEDTSLDQDDADLVALARKRWKQSESSHEEWRLSANESYAFVAGDQLDDVTKALYEEKLRPIVSFNLTAKYIDAVAGLQINNRQDINFAPRQTGDAPVNDIANEVVSWARDGCDASDEESDAFWDMLCTGMGWVEHFMDYEEDPEGLITSERRDTQQMRWDTRARKRNLRDMRWVQRGKPMSADEINERWPDADWGEPDDMMDNIEEIETAIHDATRAPFYESEAGNTGGGEVRTHTVLEMQWYKVENHMLVKVQQPGTQPGQPPQMIEKMIRHKDWIAKFKPFLEKNNVQHKAIPRKKRVYYRMFQVGTTLLQKGLSPCQSGFTYKCMTGKRNRNDNSWYGLVNAMKDPQLWVNKLLSQILHTVDTNAKGGILAERGAFENPMEAERDWSSPDKIVWMEDGAISGPTGKGKYAERPQTTYPQGTDRLLQIAMEAFSGVTGIPVELLGMTDRNQPGIIEQQRKQAGMAMVAWAFDAMTRYLKDTGELYLEYIKKYIPEGRIVRIAGTDGNKQYVPLVKDEMAHKYDIIADESPSSTNVKERTFVTLMQLMPHLAKMGIPPPPDFLDYTPLPADFVTSWKKMMQPDPQKQEAQKVEMADRQADVQVKQGKAAEHKAKVTNLQADTQKKQQETRKAAAETGTAIAT